MKVYRDLDTFNIKQQYILQYDQTADDKIPTIFVTFCLKVEYHQYRDLKGEKKKKEEEKIGYYK